MKKYIIILSVLAFSCEKSYNCTIVTPNLDNPYEYEFKGTHKEMKEFENSAIGEQTINCK